jgi:hypothetical protein
MPLPKIDYFNPKPDANSWQPIKSAPKDRPILVAHEDYAGGNQTIVEWDDDRKDWECECMTHFRPEAFTHWKPLGPGPGDE